MSKSSRAGAATLLAAPVVVIMAVLVQPTLSDEAADQVAAFGAHKGAMLAGAVLQGVSIVLLLAGAGWLALALAPRARTLALAGGVLAVLGSLPVVYDDGLHAAVAAVALGLDPQQAVSVAGRILSSAGAKSVEPFSLVGDVGLALLGLGAARFGSPRWAGAAIVLGAFGEGAGFATGTKALVVAAFVVLLAGFAATVRELTRDGSKRALPAVEAATA
jgi:hypothetical protein